MNQPIVLNPKEVQELLALTAKGLPINLLSADSDASLELTCSLMSCFVGPTRFDSTGHKHLMKNWELGAVYPSVDMDATMYPTQMAKISCIGKHFHLTKIDVKDRYNIETDTIKLAKNELILILISKKQFLNNNEIEYMILD